MKITMEEFAKEYNPCIEAQEWAKLNCKSMREVWEKVKPEWLVWIATRKDILPVKTLRLFALYCAKQVKHLTKDERIIKVIEITEKYLNGEVSRKELIKAKQEAAYAAAAYADADAAYAAADATVKGKIRQDQANWLRTKNVENPFEGEQND